MSVEYGQPQEWGAPPQVSGGLKPERPLGVTILAVLAFLGGILAILGGILISVLGAAFASMMAHGMGLPAFLFAALGIVLIIVGAIDLAIGWGLWKGAGWAWWLTVIFSGLGALLAIVSLASGNVGSIVSLIIDGIILYYFFKPHVKQFFGISVGFTT